MSDGKTDAIECVITGYAVVCTPCITRALNGAAQHETTQLLRDGYMHALDPDKKHTLCGIEAGE